MRDITLDTGWRGTNEPSRWCNYGKRWTLEEKQILLRTFNQGKDLEAMCVIMGRPFAGVIVKLEEAGVVGQCDRGYYYRLDKQQRHAASYGASSPQIVGLRADNVIIDTPKEITMNQTTPNIETKTFINGADASGMSDAAIFSKIATLEAEHNRLDGIQNKPNKLVAVMVAIKEDIAKLVAYVDGR